MRIQLFAIFVILAGMVGFAAPAAAQYYNPNQPVLCIGAHNQMVPCQPQRPVVTPFYGGYNAATQGCGIATGCYRQPMQPVRPMYAQPMPPQYYGQPRPYYGQPMPQPQHYGGGEQYSLYVGNGGFSLHYQEGQQRRGPPPCPRGCHQHQGRRHCV